MDGQNFQAFEELRISVDDSQATHLPDGLVVRVDTEQVPYDLPYQRPRTDTLTNSNINSDSDTITGTGTVQNMVEDLNQNPTRPVISGHDVDNCNTNSESGTSSSTDSQNEGTRGTTYEVDREGRMQAYVDFGVIYQILKQKGLEENDPSLCLRENGTNANATA